MGHIEAELGALGYPMINEFVHYGVHKMWW